MTRRANPGRLVSVVGVLAVVGIFIQLHEYLRRIGFAAFRFSSIVALDFCICVTQIGIVLLFAYEGLLTATTVYCIIGITSALWLAIWLFRDRRTFAFSKDHIISDFREGLVFWAVGARGKPVSLCTDSAVPLGPDDFSWCCCRGYLCSMPGSCWIKQSCHDWHEKHHWTIYGANLCPRRFSCIDE